MPQINSNSEQRAEPETELRPSIRFEHPRAFGLDHPSHPNGAYATNEQHLSDELSRIDCLIRAQTRRWKLTIGASKPAELWGMVHVTDSEIDSYLKSDFLGPGGLPAEVEAALADDWRAAAATNVRIRSRIESTTS